MCADNYHAVNRQKMIIMNWLLYCPLDALVEADFPIMTALGAIFFN